MELAHPAGVCAGDDGSGSIHDIDIAANGGLQLIDDPGTVLRRNKHTRTPFVNYTKMIAKINDNYKDGCGMLKQTKSIAERIE